MMRAIALTMTCLASTCRGQRGAALRLDSLAAWNQFHSGQHLGVHGALNTLKMLLLTLEPTAAWHSIAGLPRVRARPVRTHSTTASTTFGSADLVPVMVTNIPRAGQPSSLRRRAGSAEMLKSPEQHVLTIYKKDIVDEVVIKAGVSKMLADRVISSTLDVIIECIAAGNKVTMVGFGSFDRRWRPERQGRNFKTGEYITKEAQMVPTFKFGKTFKAVVSSAAAAMENEDDDEFDDDDFDEDELLP